MKAKSIAQCSRKHNKSITVFNEFLTQAFGAFSLRVMGKCFKVNLLSFFCPIC